MKNNSSLFVVITTARACKFEKNERREITTKTSQNENEYKKRRASTDVSLIEQLLKKEKIIKEKRPQFKLSRFIFNPNLYLDTNNAEFKKKNK